MYNSEQKSKYLDNKRITTQRQYEMFFNKVELFERKLNKDISEFTLKEIESTLQQIKPKNDKQAKVYCSFINGYRKFVHDNQENIFKDVDKDFYLQFA